MEFSEMEQKILGFIQANGQVTAKAIQEELGDKAVGGIGRLLKEEVIKKEKIRIGEGYNVKSVVHYVPVKKEGE
jgi:predicted HTH transcriptional regulator